MNLLIVMSLTSRILYHGMLFIIILKSSLVLFSNFPFLIAILNKYHIAMQVKHGSSFLLANTCSIGQL